MTEHDESIDKTQAVNPQAQALKALIKASVERLLSQGTGGEAENHGLLFLGNWHDSIPRVLAVDPVLRATDVRLWMYIKLAASAGTGTAFPSYDRIGRDLNMSRATISRGIAILRATRWLTLCERVRDPGGRWRGNIYALHDEPLPLPDALHLDPEYMSFLSECAADHHHSRARRVAQGVLGTLQDAIEAGEDVMEESAHSQIERRMEAITSLQASGQQGGFFAFSRERIGELNSSARKFDRDSQVQKSNSVNEVQKLNLADQVHNLNLDGAVQKLNSRGGVQKLNSRSSSSSDLLNKKTTTTAESKRTELGEKTELRSDESLIYPDCLSANEQKLAEIHIRTVRSDLQQPVLDELGEQIRTRTKTAKPIRNAIGLLAWLCKQVKAGEMPLTSASLAAQQRRERTQKIEAYDERKKQEVLAYGQAGRGDEG